MTQAQNSGTTTNGPDRPVDNWHAESNWPSPHPASVAIKMDDEGEEGSAPTAPALAAAVLPPPDGPPPGTPPTSPPGTQATSQATGFDATDPLFRVEKEEILERQMLLSLTSTTRYQGPGYDRDKVSSPSFPSIITFTVH